VTEPLGRSARSWRWAIAALVATVVAALVFGSCTAGPPGPSRPLATAGHIDHPTETTTVILRVDEGGGFVAPSFFVTQAPAFSLYGDGTAIFRDPSTEPPPGSGEVIRSVPFRTVRLSEDEAQGLLAFALGPGGLLAARAQYQLPVADAPTTTFTIAAGGITKTVSVNGLGIGGDGGPDAPILAALASLRARLMGFGSSVTGTTEWQPDRYRGILMEVIGGGDQPGRPIAWPWTTIAPSDFMLPADPNGPRWPIRVLTPTDVAALGITHLEGGARGILLKRPAGVPAGMPYEFALRPLLPDESR
jgi:hypothetical protein